MNSAGSAPKRGSFMDSISTIPDWLREALVEYKPAFSHKRMDEDWPRAPKEGELRVAYPMGPDIHLPRLILVTSVSLREGFISAILVSTELNMATDRDLRLEPNETGLSYGVILELDITGPLWFVQLGPCLGTIPQGILPAILRAIEGDTTDLPEDKRGLPVSVGGLRWEWKRHELAEFHNLTSDCASSLVEHEQEAGELVDIGLLDPAVTTNRCIVSLMDHFEYLEPFPPEAVHFLIEGGFLDVEKWRGTLGLDALNAMAPLIERGITSENLSVMSANRSNWHPERSDQGSATVALMRLIQQRVTEGHRSVRLKTGRFLWKLSKDSGDIGIFALDIPRHGRVQIISHFLDREVSV